MVRHILRQHFDPADWFEGAVYAEPGLDGANPREQDATLWESVDDAIEVARDATGHPEATVEVGLYEVVPADPRSEPYGIPYEHLHLRVVIVAGVP